MTDDTTMVTFELPLEADDDGLSVDALFTALDHASAYHNHEEGNHYVETYNLLESRLYGQARDQIDTE